MLTTRLGTCSTVVLLSALTTRFVQKQGLFKNKVCSKTRFVQTQGLFKHKVCSKTRFVQLIKQHVKNDHDLLNNNASLFR